MTNYRHHFEFQDYLPGKRSKERNPILPPPPLCTVYHTVIKPNDGRLYQKFFFNNNESQHGQPISYWLHRQQQKKPRLYDCNIDRVARVHFFNIAVSYHCKTLEGP